MILLTQSILGIDIQEIKIPRRAAVVVGGPPVFTFRVWDFAGQEDYYATHQCFLSQRSLFLLIWDATEREKGEISTYDNNIFKFQRSVRLK